MSHGNKKCLKMQSKAILDKLFCPGRSKNEDKIQAAEEWNRLRPNGVSKQQYINAAIRDKIYSYKTLKTYVEHINYFLKFCEVEKKCKTLKQCREYVDEWLQSRIDAGLSPYTLKLEAAALGKLYQEPTSNFVQTPARLRAGITRSRGKAKRDNGFSYKNNKEIIEFCKGTGLRRSELESLVPDQLVQKGDEYYLKIKGKGGKVRLAPIIGPNKAAIIKKIQSTPDGEKVWGKAPSHMDVHQYRSEYATAIYKSHERPKEQIPESERYYCRGDKKGIMMDRRAMLMASKALGHNRVDVVAGHYIR